jgi:hypothetical protein
MCKLSAELRAKEEWWIHFRHPDTREEWAEQAYQRVWDVRAPSGVIEVQLSKQQVGIALYFCFGTGN